MHLHCDNCRGKNKNRYMLWYLLWRRYVGLHETVTLHFLVTSHNKFVPNRCFGLFKQTFMRTLVSSLENIACVVNNSMVSGINLPQIVGDERGQTNVPCKNWQKFL